MVAASLATPTAGAGPARVPTTLVTLQHAVYAVAQDGHRIAWAVGPCGSVTIHDLTTGRNYGFSGQLCANGGGFGDLAFGGTQVGWWAYWHGNDYHQDLGAAGIGVKANDPVIETGATECNSGNDGDLITGLAADGGTVLCSYINVTSKDGYPCDFPVDKTGGVFLASTGKQVAGPPPALAIAASGGRVAVIPLNGDKKDNSPTSEANGSVEVYDIGTGKLVATATVSGTARSIALSPTVLAVLAGFQIERFDPTSGAQLGSTTVPSTISKRISISNQTIVYGTGRQIWLLDGITGKRTLLVTAAASPVAVSINGSRVVWGENTGGKSRIVALTIPS